MTIPEPLAVANALLGQGDIAEAETWARRALSLEPDSIAAINVIGVIADRGYDFITASQAFGRALACDPHNALILGNLAGLFARFGMVEPALRFARSILALAPTNATGLAAMAHALKGAGFIDEALAIYRKALAIAVNAGVHSNLLFVLSYHDCTTSAELFAEYRRWEDRHARRHYRSGRQHANIPDPGRRPVIGYLSADFREHPLGRILAALLQHHDRGVVQVNGYSALHGSDDMTERCRKGCEVWRRITGLSDAEAADRIRQDGVDILVIVGAHTAGNRLLVMAHQPAPIQVSLDDVSTSGLQVMDYWITDPALHPEDGSETSERFTERIFRLPCFFLQPGLDDSPVVAPSPAADARSITFGSFSNPAKLTNATIAMWADALRRVPGSRIALKYVDWYADRVVQGRVVAAFAAQGIERERVVFWSGDDERNGQLMRWNGVDIALDPFPFGGWTTTFEALWMGVPVVTLAGERFAARVGLAVLSRLGLNDLIARRKEEFGAIAAKLAADPARLTSLRRSLRDALRSSSLCDGRLQARYFEAAYLEMWRLWCRSQASRQSSR